MLLLLPVRRHPSCLIRECRLLCLNNSSSSTLSSNNNLLNNIILERRCTIPCSNSKRLPSNILEVQLLLNNIIRVFLSLLDSNSHSSSIQEANRLQLSSISERLNPILNNLVVLHIHIWARSNHPELFSIRLALLVLLPEVLLLASVRCIRALKVQQVSIRSSTLNIRSSCNTRSNSTNRFRNIRNSSILSIRRSRHRMFRQCTQVPLRIRLIRP